MVSFTLLVFRLIESWLVDYHFCCLCFCCHIHEIIAKANVIKFLPCFLLGILECEVWHLILSSILSWLLRVVADRGPISACGHADFPTPFVEQTILPPLYVLCTLITVICAWIYFWNLYSIPSVYISAFMPVLYCIHCWVVIYFEIRKCNISSFVLFKDWYDYLWSLVIP